MVELGLNYSTGWLSTDKVEVLVQGPINGLEMKLDGNNTSPFVKKAGLDIEFYLGTADQPYQIKRYLKTNVFLIRIKLMYFKLLIFANLEK